MKPDCTKHLAFIDHLYDSIETFNINLNELGNILVNMIGHLIPLEADEEDIRIYVQDIHALMNEIMEFRRYIKSVEKKIG